MSNLFLRIFSNLHAITLIALLPLFFSCTRTIIFFLSHRILYRIDGAEIKDNTITTTIFPQLSFHLLNLSQKNN